MGTIKETIQQAIADFNNIETAIEESGVDVPYGTDTSEYGNKVREVYSKGISDGVASITIDDELSDSSENPVQNKVISAKIEALKKEIVANGDAKVTQKTHEEWLLNDPVLSVNEIAFVVIHIKQEGIANYVPSLLIKKGDGVSRYSQLDFISGKASNIYEWAKKANLEYNDLPSTLITKINTLESDVIEKITNTELEELLK